MLIMCLLPQPLRSLRAWVRVFHSHIAAVNGLDRFTSFGVGSQTKNPALEKRQ
jgi:hypothetical protein